MTVEELLARESIRDTLATYHVAGDRLKIDQFIGVFTEDAVLEVKGTFRHDGRAAIHAWIGGWREGSEQGKPVHRWQFIRHHLSTTHIQLTGPDTARARSYFAAYTDHGPDHCGVYVDAFRKVGDRWLIAHREIRMDWRAADSLAQQSG